MTINDGKSFYPDQRGPNSAADLVCRFNEDSIAEALGRGLSETATVSLTLHDISIILDHWANVLDAIDQAETEEEKPECADCSGQA